MTSRFREASTRPCRRRSRAWTRTSESCIWGGLPCQRNLRNRRPTERQAAEPLHRQYGAVSCGAMIRNHGVACSLGTRRLRHRRSARGGRRECRGRPPAPVTKTLPESSGKHVSRIVDRHRARVVTVIEVLSPSNKTTAQDRRLPLKREEYLPPASTSWRSTCSVPGRGRLWANPAPLVGDYYHWLAVGRTSSVGASGPSPCASR